MQIDKIISNSIDGVAPYQHKGEWSIQESVSSILDMTGPADVMLETFNISEEAIRTLFVELENKRIRSLRIIVDQNVRRHKIGTLLFARNITSDIHVTNCHSKVLLVSNEKYRIGIVGSANFNQPLRYEAGVIITNENLFNFFLTSFKEIYLHDSTPFDYE